MQDAEVMRYLYKSVMFLTESVNNGSIFMQGAEFLLKHRFLYGELLIERTWVLVMANFC